MPTTDRVTDSGTVDAAVPSAAPLVGALQSLSRAYQKTTIYTSGHPSVTEALTDAASGFEAARSEQDPIVAVISRDHFLFGDEPLAEANEALTTLAGTLF